MYRQSSKSQDDGEGAGGHNCGHDDGEEHGHADGRKSGVSAYAFV